jgi:ribosome recycling factor
MSEDELSVILDEIQEITDKHIKEIDQVLNHKEKEIMEV